MKKTTCIIIGLLCSSAANASLITSGSIQRLDGDQSSIDFWGFSTSGGNVVMDLLSWEVGYLSNAITDVNNDGEIAFFDTQIYLLRDDGVLDQDDLIDRNDDASTTLSTDGSIHFFDSYISSSLTSGDYFLAVGAFGLSMNEVLSGVNNDDTYPVSCSGAIGEACVPQTPSDHGDYQITWSGDVEITSNPGSVASVPEPGTIALLGLGLLGLGISRKRKAQ